MKIKLVNSLQRCNYSLDKLIDLRQQMREVYSIRKKGEYLSTSKNRHSPYYNDIKSDILELTEESISEGTLVKFFLVHYINGIHIRERHYTEITTSKSGFTVELNIDHEDLLTFHVNDSKFFELFIKNRSESRCIC